MNTLQERTDEGATAVEYGLMLALIFMVIIAAVTALGITVNGIFVNISGLL